MPRTDQVCLKANVFRMLGGGGAAGISLCVALSSGGLVIASGVGILCAVWAAGRSLSELKDRSDHQMSVSGLEAIPLWLSVFAGASGTYQKVVRWRNHIN